MPDRLSADRLAEIRAVDFGADIKGNALFPVQQHRRELLAEVVDLTAERDAQFTAADLIAQTLKGRTAERDALARRIAAVEALHLPVVGRAWRTERLGLLPRVRNTRARSDDLQLLLRRLGGKE